MKGHTALKGTNNSITVLSECYKGKLFDRDFTSVGVKWTHAAIWLEWRLDEDDLYNLGFPLYL